MLAFRYYDLKYDAMNMHDLLLTIMYAYPPFGKICPRKNKATAKRQRGDRYHQRFDGKPRITNNICIFCYVLSYYQVHYNDTQR